MIRKKVNVVHTYTVHTYTGTSKIKIRVVGYLKVTFLLRSVNDKVEKKLFENIGEMAAIFRFDNISACQLGAQTGNISEKNWSVKNLVTLSL